MKQVKTLLLLLLAIVFLASCASAPVPQAPVAEPDVAEQPVQVPAEEPKSPQVGYQQGDLAFDFTLKGLDGQMYTLSEYQGTPTLLVFWSVDCYYCMIELPDLEKYYDADGYEILAVNATFVDGEERARSSVEELGLTFPVLLLDEEEAFYSIATAYNLGGIPHNVYVDKDGVIAKVQIGAVPGQDSVNYLKELAQ